MRLGVLLTAIGLLSACASPTDVSGDWRLETGTLDGRPVPLVAGHRITLLFDAQTAMGRSACNWYGGRISRQGGGFRVMEIGNTAAFCADEVMASENAYLEALRRISLSAVVGDRLVLSGAGVELRFARPEHRHHDLWERDLGPQALTVPFTSRTTGPSSPSSPRGQPRSGRSLHLVHEIDTNRPVEALADARPHVFVSQSFTR